MPERVSHQMLVVSRIYLLFATNNRSSPSLRFVPFQKPKKFIGKVFGNAFKLKY